MPGKNVNSVHLANWKSLAFSLSESEIKQWEYLLKARSILLPALELKRRDKTIGKSLDAKVQPLASHFPELANNVQLNDTLRELLCVSQLEFLSYDPQTDYTGRLVVHADGQKCERCWHWETGVGSVPEHPALCPRCAEAVKHNNA
jgi:isoleucyl-tRNA synthetase